MAAAGEGLSALVALEEALAAHAGNNAIAGARIGPRGVERAFVNCDPEARFEIGSITKVLTALILCEAVVNGQCSLDDSLDQWLPESVGPPRSQGKSITLRNLATHSSGLPRLPNGMLFLDVFRKQPYARWDRARLARAIHSAVVSFPPGSAYQYSNFGFASLGLALERICGQPYETLAQGLTARLGCPEMRLPIGGDEARLAKAPRAAPWQMAAFAPAGGVTSTLDALAQFAKLNLAPEKPPALVLAVQERSTFPKLSGKGQTQTLGLGWHITGSGPGEVVWHNGGTAAFHSFLGFRPAMGDATLVLAAGSQSVDALGMKLFSLP